MKRPALLLCLACAIGFTLPLLGTDALKVTRTWKSSDGRELKADLLEFDAKEIKLKRASDFQVIKVPLDKFSDEDRSFVAGLVHERNLNDGLKAGPYAEKITGAFVKGVSKQGLNYQLFGSPKWDGTKRYPLVIWLHGSGSSGTDNQAQMGGATGVFTNAAHQDKNPCFMLAPQCPDQAIGWKKQVADNLMLLIADLADKLPVDMKRLYLGGSSMGGFGTWSLCAKYPKVFAVGVPLCGGGDPKQADLLKDVPLWAFLGDQDPMVPVDRDRVAVAAVKAAGGTLIHYTELAGEGHNITGIVLAKEDLHDWIFAQRLGVREK
ncbi:MAG: phospholipase/Carboxylesterase [Verrucomicrobiaceae bacterium]|nr:phospholipase/Carboxylesterase [Verrucomicrobiaceae bacterium]